ncbi:MAG: glycogen debranching protein GlgX [Verrucomicrobiales bacterium]
MTVNDLELLPSRAYPIGVSRLSPDVEEAFNFAIFSAHATAVDLCLFERADPGREVAQIRLPHRTGKIWHVAVAGIRSGQYYAYRVHGAYDPSQGHRFNPNKLLVDPAARAIAGRSLWHPSMAGGGDSDRDEFDSAQFVSKGIVVDETFDWDEDSPPSTPLDQSIIYELHVTGFTRRFPEIDPGIRGTYAGLGSEPVTEYLRHLGVTAIQLLPVHHHLDDGFLLERGLSNYWGYNTIGFFAPEARYATGGGEDGAQVREFKEMVKKMHQAGIEVILDVVYNHTAEGNEMGPTLNFRGIDNASYYRLENIDPRRYRDYTGTGNTLNTQHPHVLELVIESLRYWVTEMHVDGFRFDLAAVLGREETDFSCWSGFFKAVQCDPVLHGVKLIAEPWDVGWGGYQVGNFPTRWSELNGRYRDAVRRFWKGDHLMLPEFTYRYSGSEDIYGPAGRKPQASVNFLTSHDGFTMRDLVSYNHKHNEANKEDNRDGDENNHSWNHGVEGESQDPGIKALRDQQLRNFFATMLLSQGVPFVLSGDELGRTQSGNNNAYCQDNEVSWIDWELDRSQQRFLKFVQRLIKLRKEHAIFGKTSFFHGYALRGQPQRDVVWFHPRGTVMSASQWHEDKPGQIAALMNGSTRGSQENWRETRYGRSFLFLFNASGHQRTFTLPGTASVVWKMELDTARIGGFYEQERLVAGASKVVVASRSMRVLTLHEGSESDAQRPVQT